MWPEDDGEVLLAVGVVGVEVQPHLLACYGGDAGAYLAFDDGQFLEERWFVLDAGGLGCG